MSVGVQTSNANFDQTLTKLAVQLRGIMDAIRVAQVPVGSGGGLAYMESLGYSNSPNAANPGGVSDAQYALNLMGYMNSLSQVYYGQLQQGGSGGTGATLFNFESALSAVWGGQ